MSMRITAIVAGVYTEYGIAVPVGTTITVGDDYGLSLVRSLRATDTDGVLNAPARRPFDTAAVLETDIAQTSLSKAQLVPIGLERPGVVLEGRGDSYVAGTGLNPLTDVFTARLAATLGLANFNMGVGGSGVLTQYTNMTSNVNSTVGVAMRPSQTQNRSVVWMPGLNDYRAGNSEARLNTFRGFFATGLLLALGNWAAFRQNYNGRSATFFGAPAGSLATSGSWSLSLYGKDFEWRGMFSTTNANTYTATVQGDVIYVCYNRQKTNTGGTFSVTVDGVVVEAQIVCDGTNLATVAGGETTTANANGYPTLLRIPASKGLHTVVITVTSATSASNVVGIEFCAGNDDAIGNHTAIVLGTPRLNAAGYAASPAAYGSVTLGDAAAAAFQQIVQEVVSQLKADGFSITFADTSAYSALLTTNVQPDNLHATFSGQTFFYNAALIGDGGQQAKATDANPGDAFAIVAPANLTPYRSTFRNRLELFLTGGTVTAVEFSRDGLNWLAVAGATPAQVILNPSDQFRVTYTVAPTITAIPR